MIGAQVFTVLTFYCPERRYHWQSREENSKILPRKKPDRCAVEALGGLATRSHPILLATKRAPRTIDLNGYGTRCEGAGLAAITSSNSGSFFMLWPRRASWPTAAEQLAMLFRRPAHSATRWLKRMIRPAQPSLSRSLTRLAQSSCSAPQTQRPALRPARLSWRRRHPREQPAAWQS